ncbi:MAG: hypothetical protein HPY44_13395 [Armatimonadetes bacterium]|nr:hypothetical protein [Armatimonadota bacterium]
MSMSRLLIAALCVIATLCPAQPEDWPSAGEVSRILSAVPGDLPTVSLTSGPDSYTRADVEKVAGPFAKELFAYDYNWSVAATYRIDGNEVRAELHRFATELDAFGAHSAIRDPRVPGQVIPLDRPTNVIAAFWAKDVLHVWRGPFFARFVPVSVGDAGRSAVLRLAPAVLSKLPSMPASPRLFSIPPDRGMVVESVKYVRKDVLGQPALRNALSATYGRRLPGKIDAEMQLWLIDALNASGASQAFATVRGYLMQAAIPRPVGALGEEAIVLRHPKHGQTYVMREGAYVAVLEQVKDAQAAEAVLRTIGKNVRTGQ